MLADGHTKGTVDRAGLIEAMSGRQTFRYAIKSYEPYRGGHSGAQYLSLSEDDSELVEYAYISLFSAVQAHGDVTYL